MQNDIQDKPISLANLSQAISGVKGNLYQPATYTFSDITALTNEQIDTLLDSASVGDIIVQQNQQTQRLKVIGTGFESRYDGMSYHIIAAGTDGIYRIDKIGSSYGYTYGVTRGNCYTEATATASGLMAGSDKAKLDNLNRDWTVYVGSVWPSEDKDSLSIGITYGGGAFSTSDVHIGDIVRFEESSPSALSNSNFVVEGLGYVCFHKAGSQVQFIGPAKNEGLVVIEANVTGNSGTITARPLVSKTLASDEADGLMSAADKAKLDESIIYDGVKTIGKFTFETTPAKGAAYDMSEISEGVSDPYHAKAILIGYDNDYAVFADVSDVSNKFTIENWETMIPSFHEGVYGYEGTIIPDSGIELAIKNAGKAYAGAHTHSAEEIKSGIFEVDRIPSLPASKITSGTFDTARIPALTSYGNTLYRSGLTIYLRNGSTNLGSSVTIPTGTTSTTVAAGNHTHSEYAASDHTHDASAITSGTFDAARIPSLAASKITTGTVASARLPSVTDSASGILSYTNFRYLLSSTTATSITALSTSYRQVVASISASASFAFTGTTAFAAGREIHVLIKNTGSEEITVTLPNSGIYDNGGTDTLTIPAGGHAEVNAISDGSKIYLRAVA